MKAGMIGAAGLLAAGVALAALPAWGQGAAAGKAAVGQPAPAFRVKDLGGQEKTLASYRGKVIVLAFSASW